MTTSALLASMLAHASMLKMTVIAFGALREAATLQADIAVLDEIDSGLDIDALRDVADAVNSLKRPNSATLMVTHYKVNFGRRILGHCTQHCDTLCNTNSVTHGSRWAFEWLEACRSRLIWQSRPVKLLRKHVSKSCPVQ